jgi:hypothetical protein
VADAEAQARKEVPPIGAPIPETPMPTSSPARPTPAPALTKEAPAPAPPREGRPQQAAPSPAVDPQPESALPTPPRGMPQVGGERGNGGPRPGYPAPPRD